MLTDTPLSVENTPFFWGIAFSINIVLGACSFFLIIRKPLSVEWRTVLGWIGWWSFANALSLIVNIVAGPSDPFSYHQMGVFTESMVNLGYIALAILFYKYDPK